LTETTLSAAFEAACRRHNQATAMVEPSGAPVSFAGLFFTTIAFAERLQAAGVGPGSLIAVQIADPIAGLALRLALLRLGATVLTVPRGFPAEGLPGPLRHLVPAQAATGAPDEIPVAPDWLRPPQVILPVAGTGALVKSTSGTTGLPKLRHFTEGALLARVRRGMALRGAAEGPVLVGYGPASSPGFNYALRTILAGQPQLSPLATPEATLSAMDRLGVTTAYASPYNFQRLFEAARASGLRPRALSRILVGGGSLSPDLAARAEALFGAEVFNTYGSNETSSIAHHRPSLTPDQPGLVGPIYPDIGVRFLDETGTPGAVEGELSLRPPPGHLPTDYPSGRPLTDAEGWIATGDLGHLTPDGAFVLTGRKSELLNIGGAKKAPSVFETALSGFPGLAGIAAFRAPQAGGMDHVGLAVVPGEGFDATAFRAFAETRLGPLYPSEIVVLDHLPVTEAGKIDRKRLTAEFGGQNSPIAI
jgi:acyl-coenzyme A synthetase/AMP-(fatty) acid ligase